MKNILLSATILAASIFASCQKSDIQPTHEYSDVHLVSGTNVIIQAPDTIFIMMFGGVDYRIKKGQTILQNISHTEAIVSINGNHIELTPGVVVNLKHGDIPRSAKIGTKTN